MSVDRLRSGRNRLRWSRIDPNGPGLHAPKREGDVGWDLEAAEEIVIPAFTQVDIPTNIRLELPKDVWAEVRARSSIAKRHLQIEAGTIDPGYRGPILALLRFLGPPDVAHPLHSVSTCRIKKGERIAQLVFHRVCEVWAEEVPEVSTDTERGTGGFGSTGT